MKDVNLFKYDRLMKLGMTGEAHPDMLFPKAAPFSQKPSSNTKVGGTSATPKTL
jgi:hypothetical protein